VEDVCPCFDENCHRGLFILIAMNDARSSRREPHRHTLRAVGVSFADFSDLVTTLGAWARRRGFRVPGIQSPPRVPGADRVVRRFQGEVRTVAVTVRGRTRTDVVSDVVSGILVANGISRDLWPELIADALAAVPGRFVGPVWADAA
jgi:hypothetical protein